MAATDNLTEMQSPGSIAAISESNGAPRTPRAPPCGRKASGITSPNEASGWRAVSMLHYAAKPSLPIEYTADWYCSCMTGPGTPRLGMEQRFCPFVCEDVEDEEIPVATGTMSLAVERDIPSQPLHYNTIFYTVLVAMRTTKYYSVLSIGHREQGNLAGRADSSMDRQPDAHITCSARPTGFAVVELAIAPCYDFRGFIAGTTIIWHSVSRRNTGAGVNVPRNSDKISNSSTDFEIFRRRDARVSFGLQAGSAPCVGRGVASDIGAHANGRPPSCGSQRAPEKFSGFYNLPEFSPKGGRPPRLKFQHQALAVILAFYVDSLHAKMACMYFGAPPATLNRVLNAAEVALGSALNTFLPARISRPSPTRQRALSKLTALRESLLQFTWGIIGEKKLKVLQLADPDVQNAFYNGWLHDVFVNGTLCFGADGLIVWARHNCPGSWNDAENCVELRENLINPDLCPDMRYGVVADSDFPCSGHMAGRILTPLKEGDLGRLIPSVPESAQILSAAITSIRQAAEWGMGSKPDTNNIFYGIDDNQ
ncbi:hypothetical protein ON010_g8782 [Phytophthora cinnamomi]|nr:hypothetical protein ON010_g8782 [Phytophthora cinnamomi]